MYHSNGLKIPNLDLRELEQDSDSEGGTRFFRGWRNVESGEVGLFAEHAHLECCTEVRLFDACFFFACGQ